MQEIILNMSNYMDINPIKGFLLSLVIVLVVREFIIFFTGQDKVISKLDDILKEIKK